MDIEIDNKKMHIPKDIMDIIYDYHYKSIHKDCMDMITVQLFSIIQDYVDESGDMGSYIYPEKIDPLAYTLSHVSPEEGFEYAVCKRRIKGYFERLRYINNVMNRQQVVLYD